MARQRRSRRSSGARLAQAVGRSVDKQFLALARVSSREQEREGWSLHVQDERLNGEASRRGGTLFKLFKVAETATRSEERAVFREFVACARENAHLLSGLMFYKINGAARNLRDYVELEGLEGELGLPLISVTEPTENTPAGRMFRRQLAVFATFQTEQQEQDVRDGQRRRVEAGLFVGVAPYGYRNVRVDGRGLVETDPVQAARVKLIFDAYAHRHVTLDGVCDYLHREGVPYTPAQARWKRSTIHQILTSRAYLGEVPYQGQWLPGVHEPLVTIALFDRVQTLLGGAIYKSHELTYAGELIECGHCGGVVTGERIVKKKTCREYVYYRCSRYNQPGHPRVRLTEADLDRQVIDLFARIRQPEEIQDWFGEQLRKLVRSGQQDDCVRVEDLQRQLTQLRGQQDQLLNLRLNDEITSETFAAKSTELRDRVARVQLRLEATDRGRDEQAEHAIRVFELSQRLREHWLAADFAAKRQILDLICLNLRLDGATLMYTTRKPFDLLVEGLESAQSRGDRI